MGISGDNCHKQLKTGGKRKPNHKKRKDELGRPAANAKIGPRHINTVRFRGGSKKYRALRLAMGNFSWVSEGCTRKTRITDAVYNESNNELARNKTLAKNCDLLIYSTPNQHYALPLGRKQGAKLMPEEEEILNRRRSKKIQKTYDERTITPKSALTCKSSSSRASFLPVLPHDPARGAEQIAMWRGQAAGVLSEEDQSPERQINHHS